PGGMRRTKLLLVDDAVAVAIEGEQGGGGIFDFFRIEPVIVVAIEGLAERIKRRRAGRASAELGRWASAGAPRRLGDCQGAEADHGDRRGDPAPGSCSKFHRIHPAF
ncbi:MAG: hypothetical protein DWH87_03315, partial [Planctomycetota bacterium]